MFRLMGRIQNVVLAAAGLATAGLFGISVSDIRGCASASKVQGQAELSADEHQQILRKLKIGAALSNRNLPSENIEEVIVNYHSSLKNARLAGISVSDYELGSFIHEQFGEKQAYGNFCKAMEMRHGLQVSELEAYFRDQLAMSKNSRLPLLATYVTTAELKAEFHRRHDRLIYDKIAVDPTALKLEKELTSEELKAYFEENSINNEEFQIPDKVAVTYLLVRPESLTIEPITDEDLQQNYNLNKASYSASGNADDAKPFEEVKDEVKAKVEKQTRQDLAKRILNDLDNILLDQETIDLLGTLETQKTANPKFSVVESGTTELFAEKDYRVEPLGYVFNLASRLFGKNPRDYGGVLEAGNGFYIYQVDRREAARSMTFEEAQASVVEALTLQRQTEMAEALAKDWKEKVIASADWSTLTLPTGIKYESKEVEGISNADARQLSKLEIGVVSEPQKLENSVALLRLKERVVADETLFDSEKDELRQGLQQQKGYMMGNFGGM